MDEHDLPGVKAKDVVGAHEADVRVQGKFRVTYKHYWVRRQARCSAWSRRPTR